MEKMDPNVEAQVWQRVFARPAEPAGDDLRGLLLAAMEQAAAYRYLAGILTGRAKERVKGLHEGEAASVACLKGLRILSGGAGEPLKVPDTPREPARKVLEKCYHRSRRIMVEYTARSAEAEFGVVFQKLAEQEAKHCTLIAQLLGLLH